MEGKKRATTRRFLKLAPNRKWILNKMGGAADVVVIGEDPSNMAHAFTIADRIKELGPEYVLMESLNDKPPIKLKGVVDCYKARTLDGLCQQQRVSIGRLNIGKDTLREIQDRIGIEVRKTANLHALRLLKTEKEALESARDAVLAHGQVPATPEDLRNTPLYMLHPCVIDVLQDLVHDAWLNRKEIAGHKAMELVRRLRMYKREGSLDETTKKRRHDIIMSAVADVDAKLAGCDIDKSDLAKTVPVYLLDKIPRSYRHSVEQIIDNVAKPDAQLLEKAPGIREFFDKLNRTREQAMFENIRKYADKRSSDAPIIAIVGQAHLNGIRERLKETELKHKIMKLPPVCHL